MRTPGIVWARLLRVALLAVLVVVVIALVAALLLVLLPHLVTLLGVTLAAGALWRMFRGVADEP